MTHTNPTATPTRYTVYYVENINVPNWQQQECAVTVYAASRADAERTLGQRYRVMRVVEDL